MRKLFFIVIGVLITATSFCQSVSSELISSAGDSYSNPTYQLEWSIGECVTETYSTSGYILTQGFHQPSYEITLIGNFFSEIDISVYPNPTSDLLMVNFYRHNVSEGDIIITDINGKVLRKKNITADNEELDFSNYVSGTYFLIVTQENKKIKSFKIIKN